MAPTVMIIVCVYNKGAFTALSIIGSVYNTGSLFDWSSHIGGIYYRVCLLQWLSILGDVYLRVVYYRGILGDIL